MRLFAADIGGTKTMLALAEADAESIGLVSEQRLENSAYDDLDALLDAFLAQFGRAGSAIDAACCAVAGPVSADGRSARLTNRGWDIDADRISRLLDHATTRLINDFTAVGYGIDRLAETDIERIQAGQPRSGAPRVVIGPGTGLGVGWLVHNGERYQVYPSEGGHVDFAPNGALQRELLAWLVQRYHGHVSAERIVSGSGLVDIYRFLCERELAQGRGQLDPALAAPDPAAWVSNRAREVPGSLAGHALDLFVSVYGAVAGNLALTVLPYGGLYLAGGITPKIMDRLRDGRFLAAFNDKGRMSTLAATIPVAAVMNPAVGLLGALQAAHESAAIRRPDNRS
jgi:glucokinase